MNELATQDGLVECRSSAMVGRAVESAANVGAMSALDEPSEEAEGRTSLLDCRFKRRQQQREVDQPEPHPFASSLSLIFCSFAHLALLAALELSRVRCRLDRSSLARSRLARSSNLVDSLHRSLPPATKPSEARESEVELLLPAELVDRVSGEPGESGRASFVVNHGRTQLLGVLVVAAVSRPRNTL